ncbi:Uncharacterised protein [Chryseobacterium taklimakanense]|uniref:Mobilization protein n=1 Tax=Chryseobacterium taklimakanense TaxID=536441 RepID=A0A239X8C5_9FLAO|nr:AAA family ATPase [Chryseobacterium taklimakanense]SNV42971.1 Uncharacterised protein [Chryseobacterium taklimakanense]
MTNEINIPLAFAKKPQKPETSAEELLEELEQHRILVTDEIPEPEIAIKMFIDENPDDHAIIGTLGNFSVLTGKAKSKKTFAIGILTASLFSEKPIMRTFQGCLPTDQNKVIYFDTEQGKWHVQRSLKRICRLAGITDDNRFSVYGLRSEPTDRRLALIEAKIYNTENLGFVVIDGVRDITFDINDPKEASDIAGRFLKWTEERNIHIITILHQNKGDSNARGHLGTELINKAETVLAVERANNSDVSVVTPTQTRNKEPEPFAFEIDQHGLPFKARVPENDRESKQKFTPDMVTEEQLEKLFFEVFNQEQFKPLGYDQTLRQLAVLHLGIIARKVGENFLKNLITRARNEQIILQPDELQKGKSKPNILNPDIREKFEKV